jgi:hypothetical protein
MTNRCRKYSTSYLFTRPNFLTGSGSVFNLRGSYFLFNYSKNSQEADARALEHDWGVIGQDIRMALKKISNNTSVVR